MFFGLFLTKKADAYKEELKKRPAFLLEILIGLALLSILLSFLFTSMSRSVQFEAKIESARIALSERETLQTRLQDLFLSLRNGSLYTKKMPGDKIESLIAICDHGIDPDPAFSGPVLSRVYLDENNNLAMVIWPLDTEKRKRPWRNEILLSHVERFEFHFLGKKIEPGIIPVNAQFAWYDRWPQKCPESPSMVRLMIRQKGALLSYAFFVVHPEPFVTYWEGGDSFSL